jgi:hypothetical protein
MWTVVCIIVWLLAFQCIPDPTLAEGELETRKLLLLRTFDGGKDLDDDVDSQSREDAEPSLPAAKKLARLVEVRFTSTIEYFSVANLSVTILT